VLVLLPPSETKAPGGDGPAVDLDALLWPELRPTRSTLLDALIALAGDLPAARAALKVTASKDDDILGNAHLRTATTLPALDRYTGVLYDALDAASMSRAERSRAGARILVMSALFGATRATDPIPCYRLSAGSTLPGLGTVAPLWRAAAGPLLAVIDAPVLDLRSGAYAAFGPIPGAITARVVSRQPDGRLAVVSHFNKATKGRLARLVATAPREPSSLRSVLRLARGAGLDAEQTGPRSLQIVT
jgi:cytoplasmic iron level regulating protein YaaA (DUF328/UPF0246 family)